MGRKVDPDVEKNDEFRGLSPVRLSNKVWKYRTNLMRHLPVPLPLEIVCELERKAGVPENYPWSAATTEQGGPRWLELYDTLVKDMDLDHLNPSSKLVPQTKLVRETARRPSPYAARASPYETSTMLAFVREGVFKRQQGKNGLKPIRIWRPRQLRRFYQILLREVPLISPRPIKTTLWDPKIRYIVQTWRWRPGLLDFPSYFRDA